MCGVCVLGVLGSLGCAAESIEPEEVPVPAETHIEPVMCEPLRGVYRVTYARKNGDCADLPMQLAKFKDDATMSALSSKCIGVVATSDDFCDRSEEGDCDVIDGAGVSIGTAHLSSMFTQTSEVRIEGSTTISLQTLEGAACSASYALIGDKVHDI
jgi:hypothetical protein